MFSHTTTKSLWTNIFSSVSSAKFTNFTQIITQQHETAYCSLSCWNSTNRRKREKHEYLFCVLKAVTLDEKYSPVSNASTLFANDFRGNCMNPPINRYYS